MTTSEVSVSVTVDDDRQLDEIVPALREFAEVTVERDMAILCAVGDSLRADPRMAIACSSALEGVPLRMVSQAASRRNVTVVLSDRDVATAMHAAARRRVRRCRPSWVRADERCRAAAPHPAVGHGRMGRLSSR